MVLESLIYAGPVTSVFHGSSFILAGIGSCVHLYVTDDKLTWQKIMVTEVLPGRNIHGLRQDPRIPCRFISYGQKCMRLVEIDLQTNKILCLHNLIEFPDWIFDVTWVQDKSDWLCLALAHNVVITFDLGTERKIQSVNCAEKCILYCAKFISTTSQTLVLAAGTVFNEVVLWSPLTARNNEEHSEPFHRLTGHQGVIFSIDYNPELQYLCSASDDRSIRLYKIDFPEIPLPQTLSGWMKMKSSLLHVLYGHQARVWDVKLLTDQLISVGEDSTCCVWSYEGRVIQKFRGHKGKSIWSVAVSRDEKEVITGGGGYSVRLWKLHIQSGPTTYKYNTLHLQLQSEDFPRNTMFLDMNRPLVITNNGNLLMYHCESREITCLMSDADFSSYTVMTVSKSKQFIVLGNIKGTVRAMFVGESTEDLQSVDMPVYDGKVHSVVFVSDDVFVTTGPNGKINVWQVIIADNLRMIKLYVFELPPSKHRWLTSASFTSDSQYFVCGDRTGSVFIFRLKEHNMVSELIQSFPKIHGKSGVTQVCFHGDLMYSVGRDGLYRLFTWDAETASLKLQNSNRVYKGFDWLEKIVFTEEGDTLVYGFHTNMFVVWNINQNQKVLEIDCGGGHRSWDFVTLETESRFVYVKAREVKVVNMEMRSNQTVIKQSIHGREICDVKHLYSYQDTDSNPIDVVMTCSEDTTINIILVKYIDSIPQFSVLHTLSGHISSVRCLAVCPSCQTPPNKGGHFSALVISGGGRAQIRFWRVHVKGWDNETVLNNHICDKTTVIKTSVVSHESAQCDSDISNSTSVQQTSDTSFQTSEPKVIKGCTRLDILSSDSGVSAKTSQTEALTSDMCNSAVITNYKTQAELRSSQTLTNDISNSSVRTTYETLGELKLGKAGRHIKKPWRYPVDNSDPETRIIDLCLFHGEDICSIFVKSLFFFAAACSDGLVRLFAFEEQSRETTLISSSKYHNHCVLKTTHIIIKSQYSDSISVNDNASETKNEQNHIKDKHNYHQFNQVVLLSAATDGVVAFYDITELCYKYAFSNGLLTNKSAMVKANFISEDLASAGKELILIFHLQLHQSGVNSIYITHQLGWSYDSIFMNLVQNNYQIPRMNLIDYGKVLVEFWTNIHETGYYYLAEVKFFTADDSGNQFVLLTGGDDNALSISYLDIEYDGSNTLINLTKSGVTHSAHSAQVTGVWWLGSNRFLSASIDQRLCLWRVEELDKTVKLAMTDCKFISVSDVSNIDVYQKRTGEFVIIAGEGLQLFKLICEDSNMKLEDTITKHTRFVT